MDFFFYGLVFTHRTAFQHYFEDVKGIIQAIIRESWDNLISLKHSILHTHVFSPQVQGDYQCQQK